MVMQMLPLFSFSLLFLGVYGGWGTPSYELLPNLPEGIRLEGDRIFLPENVETGSGLPLLILHVDDSDIVIRESSYASFYVTNEPDGNGKTFWYFNVNETFDFEELDESEKERLVVLNLEGQNFFKYIDVEIVDVNDNSPVFQYQTPDPIDPIEESGELADLPLLILTINATDADVADNDKLIYELTENGINSTNFEVDNKGQVFIIKPLDYAIRSIHRLNIKISEPRPPFNFTHATATVFVKDIPNLPPVFTKPPIINSVTEEIAIGSTIFVAEARDGDYGLNWDVEYELDDKLGYFAIDKTSGVITVAKRIDADEDKILIENEWTYTFTLIAKEIYDENLYPNLPIEFTQSKTPVTFVIQDINDHVPLICNQPSQEIDTCKNAEDYAFTILEMDVGLVLLPNCQVIRVVDLDATIAYNRYSAVIDTDDEIIKKSFSISPERGMGDEEFFIIIKDTDAIDFENGEWQDPKNFTIVFTGDANQTHVAVANFEVTVIDVNDNTYNTKIRQNH